MLSENLTELIDQHGPNKVLREMGTPNKVMVLNTQGILPAHNSRTAFFEGRKRAVAIGLAMECYENGVITKTDMEGIEFKFGSLEAMVKRRKFLDKQGPPSYPSPTEKRVLIIIIIRPKANLVKES